MNLYDYKMIYDHHTHTRYSHGKGSIEDNVRVAHERGLESVAITEHGPGHLGFGLKLRDLPAMREEILAAEKKYPDVKVLLGAELNVFKREPFLDMDPDTARSLDLRLAGYHYGIAGAGMIKNWLWNGRHPAGLKYEEDETGEPQPEISLLLAQNTAMIVNMLDHAEEIGCHIDVLTHPGDKGPFDIVDIARACERTGTLLEINGKHPHLSAEELKIAAGYDVRFVIGSDAHTPEDVGVFYPQLARAFEAGIDPDRIVNIRKK